ncbi:hypothetical protein PM082_014338 [Marasmius tenuissimus]|nr:hypothetical protein PM082_014338 [Marasmius tenuissimus]
MGPGSGLSAMEVLGPVAPSSLDDFLSQLVAGEGFVTIADHSVEIPNNFLSILCSNNRASSWSHASIPMHPHTFTSLGPYTGLFTGLRSLHLEGIIANPKEISLDVFQNAPALDTVSIWGENDCVNDLKLPWNQVIHYTMRDSECYYASNSFHFAMLPRLENLRTCWLDCIVVDGGTPAPSPPILLPFLHTLTLSCAEPDGGVLVGLPQLMDHVILPALRTLSLRDGSLNSFKDPLLRLVERSRCCLHDLTLCTLRSGDEQDVLSLIKSGVLKDVQSLWIGWEFVRNPQKIWMKAFDLRLLPPLVRTPEGEDYLPSLRYFQTNAWDKDDILVTIAESRRSIGGRALECLVQQDHCHDDYWTLDYSKEVRAKSEKQFRELCERGLRLEWRGPPEV